MVIAAGGGGIPTVYEPGRRLRGIEAVIDKDFCSELLARHLEADFFIMATDVPPGNPHSNPRIQLSSRFDGSQGGRGLSFRRNDRQKGSYRGITRRRL
jgi:hypothetical protein